jgi:hypothetical protein
LVFVGRYSYVVNNSHWAKKKSTIVNAAFCWGWRLKFWSLIRIEHPKKKTTI